MSKEDSYWIIILIILLFVLIIVPIVIVAINVNSYWDDNANIYN